MDAEDQNKRKLADLKVAELRTELESRGKDKSGNKATLIERLSSVCVQILVISTIIDSSSIPIDPGGRRS